MSAESAGVVWPQARNEVPKEVFFREDIYAEEMKRLFGGPLWHPIALAAEVPRPHDFKTTILGDVALIVIHGADGRIRVFHNSCAHRGVQVETRFRGSAQQLECPYHRWLYDSKGALIGCPGRRDFPPSFKLEEHGLVSVRTEVRSGVVFATLSAQTPPFEEFVAGMEEGLDVVTLGGGPHRLLGYQKVLIDGNWKLYRDNDGYHTALLHKAFTWLNWQGGKGGQVITPHANMMVLAELPALGDSGRLRDPTLLTPKRGTPATSRTCITVFNPSVLITKVLDLPIARFVIPRGPERTEIQWTFFGHVDDDPALAEHRVRQANMMGPSSLVSLEDAAVFNRAQKAVHSQPSNTIFVKGWREGRDPREADQNDEIGNVYWWDSYRKLMGFRRPSDARQ